MVFRDSTTLGIPWTDFALADQRDYQPRQTPHQQKTSKQPLKGLLPNELAEFLFLSANPNIALSKF